MQAGSHIHFLGICGTAMGSLAGLFQAKGYRVTGSDENTYPPMSTLLDSLGISILSPKKENFSPAPDLVVVGNIVSPHSEEALFLANSSIPLMSMPQALGEFFLEDKISLVVAGTHGKTTTTAMLAWAAEKANLKPGFMVGGLPKNFLRSFQVSSGEYFIVEGDEYETCYLDKGSKFMHYRPQGLILHKVELDHIEYFASFENLKHRFEKFLSLVTEEGKIIGFCEDKLTNELLSKAKAKVLSFGFHHGDYQAKNIRASSGVYSFNIEHKGKKKAYIELPMFGNYNILNAVSVYALANEYHWDMELVQEALSSFQGVKRRQELIGKPNGIYVIEDFAHHPTAVKMTIESIKEHFPQKRLFAVLEPRTATSCRKIFQEAYVDALKGAEVALVVPPNSFREIPEEEKLSPLALIASLRSQGVEAHSLKDVAEVLSYLKEKASSGDQILIMSNGSFGGIYKKILDILA